MTDRLVGIWQDIFLLALPSVRVAEAFVQPNLEKDRLDVVATVRNDTEQPQRIELAGTVHPWSGTTPESSWRLGDRVLTLPERTVQLEPRSSAEVALDAWVPYVYYQPEILRFLEVVALTGATTARWEPRVALLDSDQAEAAAVLPVRGRPLVVLNPGAGDPRRRWPTEKFAAVGDALAHRGVEIAITGSAEDRQLTRAVVKSMRAEATDLAGRLSLGGLAGLLARAEVVVSNDSGPLHLAGAVGTATVGVYWCGNLINAGPLTRTRHRPAISWRLECPQCGADITRKGCRCLISFVADISVEEVLSAATELLAAAGAPT